MGTVKFAVRFVNILLAALLAGTSFGIWIGFNPLKLSANSYLEQQQNMLTSLNILMVSLVVSATIITIISAFFEKKNKPAFIILLIASGFFVACILISRFGNQPINEIIMSWTATSIPGYWTEFRDTWWLFHIIRTLTELIALCLITCVTLLYQSNCKAIK